MQEIAPLDNAGLQRPFGDHRLVVKGRILMARKPDNDTAIVYSTEHGKMCPRCSLALAKCTCGQKQTVTKGDGTVRILLETKGRKGKGVTILTGIPLNPEDLKDFAKKLKQKCGSGGTVKDGTIEIQGDHRDVMEEELTRQGYKVKRSGG